MLRALPLPDDDVRFDPHWLPASDAAALFGALQEEVAWENHPGRLFGREHPAPRLSCWISDAGAAYRYSGLLREPRPWPDALRRVRERLGATLGLDFDGVLANLYRDGRDAMGWHSDDEPELARRP